jgi:hypothetical protein
MIKLSHIKREYNFSLGHVFFQEMLSTKFITWKNIPIWWVMQVADALLLRSAGPGTIVKPMWFARSADLDITY